MQPPPKLKNADMRGYEPEEENSTKAFQTPFTVLIGSFARGTANSQSDVDILRIGHTRPVVPPAHISGSFPVSFIDYDLPTFSHLYSEGSLFLYHAFSEGVLLTGQRGLWSNLSADFRVAQDFGPAIREYIEVLQYVTDYPGYEASFVPYLSNLFKCLKNIGIFRLAKRKQYSFDKHTALHLGCDLSPHTSESLVLANSIFERSQEPVPHIVDKLKSLAAQWKHDAYTHIERLANDI